MTVFLGSVERRFSAKGRLRPADAGKRRRRPDREAIHLDSDRQGVPGSPDLTATIFAKIDASAIVVADLTSIGPHAWLQARGFKRLFLAGLALDFCGVVGRGCAGAGLRGRVIVDAFRGIDMPGGWGTVAASLRHLRDAGVTLIEAGDLPTQS